MSYYDSKHFSLRLYNSIYLGLGILGYIDSKNVDLDTIQERLYRNYHTAAKRHCPTASQTNLQTLCLR